MQKSVDNAIVKCYNNYLSLENRGKNGVSEVL